MIIFDFHIKSGTGGYVSEDANDLEIARQVEAYALPRIGEKFSYWSGHKPNRKYRTFIVTDIEHFYSHTPPKPTHITVYGIPCDGLSLFDND